MSIGYVTLEEASAYVLKYYLDTDVVNVQWTELSPESQEVLLARSLRLIESAPFTGHKASITQELAFPRCGMLEIPLDVKYAQIEEALSAFDADAIRYRAMRSQGISAYTIGGLSETFAHTPSSTDVLATLAPKTKLLLQKYCTGGYRIC